MRSTLPDDTDDVLQSVPTLPDDRDMVAAAAHYAPPRRVSVVNSMQDATMASTGPDRAEEQERSNGQDTAQSVVPICLRIARSRVPADIVDGLEQLCIHAPRRNVVMVDDDREVPAYGVAENGSYAVWWWNVVFVEDGSLPVGTLHISTSAQQFSSSPETPFVVKAHYVRRCEAFRGFGHILGALRSPLVTTSGGDEQDNRESNTRQDERLIMAALPVDECAHFTTLGTMIDCSRNGVLRVKTIKFLLKKLAMMGYNMLQLYTEDTYKIDGEPFFGYLRGGYSFEQLREIDDYAYILGIEVIPCVQTLGHLGQMLQWPRFLHLRDTSEVLLADAPETYVILRKMLTAAMKPFRTKKIHLGMDETHGLGHGRYHQLFGQYNSKDPTRIFIDHLSRVNAICQEMGLEPCIWSDMLFCLNARNNSLLGYYDSAQPPTKAVEGIPDNVELVYWDYYHTSQQSYTDRINSHRLLSRRNPWMAAGSWTWSRFWTALPFTFATNKASMNACKQRKSGVKHVFLTIWGDEGNEMDVLSSLPAWSYYAEHGYEPGQEVNLTRLRTSFDGICGGVFDDFVMASHLDDRSPEKQTVDDAIHFAPNTSKWLMWEEPALGFVSPTMQACGVDLEAHYTALAAYLQARLTSTTLLNGSAPERTTADARRDQPTNDYPLNARLRFPLLIAKTLALKSGLRLQLHEAYIGRDYATLADLGGAQSDSRLSRLRAVLRELISYHRQMWMSTYEPFGWETLELRYGGLSSRLETMHLRVARFLAHVQAGGHVGQSRGAARSNGSTSTHDEGAEVMLNATCGSDPTTYEEEVTSLEELAVPLQVVYGSADQLLDYHRVSRVTYC